MTARRRKAATNVIPFPAPKTPFESVESVESLLPLCESIPADQRMTVATNAFRLFRERGGFNPPDKDLLAAQHNCLLTAGLLFLGLAEDAAKAHGMLVRP